MRERKEAGRPINREKTKPCVCPRGGLDPLLLSILTAHFSSRIQRVQILLQNQRLQSITLRQRYTQSAITSPDCVYTINKPRTCSESESDLSF